MEVILIKEVFPLGHAGDIVKVKNGYARNYLLPQRIAVRKTKTSLAILERERETLQALRAQRTQQHDDLMRGLEGIGKLVLRVKTSAEGKLYGSVTSQHIVSVLLDEHAIDLSRRHVRLGVPLKTLGEHAVPIVVSKEHKLSLRVVLESDSGPKAQQPQTEDQNVVGLPAQSGESNESTESNGEQPEAPENIVVDVAVGGQEPTAEVGDDKKPEQSDSEEGALGSAGPEAETPETP